MIQGSPGQVALQKILVATDFSPYSETALQYGICFARRHDAILYTVSVVSAELVYDVQPPDPFYLRHTAEAKMAKLARERLSQTIHHIELIEDGYGSVADVLLELVDKFRIDLIVVGTHGRSGFKQLALGSVSEEIVNRARCAVLTVGPQVPLTWEPELKLRRILCAVDLGADSAKVVSCALGLGTDDLTHITLFHVLNLHKDVSPLQRDAAIDTVLEKLMQLIPQERNPSVEVETIVETGMPGEQILKIAETQSVDLIVIGRHHTSHPRVSAHLPWAMLHRLLVSARCPVLRVRD